MNVNTFQASTILSAWTPHGNLTGFLQLTPELPAFLCATATVIDARSTDLPALGLSSEKKGTRFPCALQMVIHRPCFEPPAAQRPPALQLAASPRPLPAPAASPAAPARSRCRLGSCARLAVAPPVQLRHVQCPGPAVDSARWQILHRGSKQQSSGAVDQQLVLAVFARIPETELCSVGTAFLWRCLAGCNSPAQG